MNHESMPELNYTFPEGSMGNLANNPDVFDTTVIMPVYNKVRHLKRSLESIKNQRIKPSSVIIVENGSTDGSDAFLENEGRDILKYNLLYCKKSPGGYYARNYGVSHATTRWVSFLDADDEWCEDHLMLHKRLSLVDKSCSVLFSLYRVMPGRVSHKKIKEISLVELNEKAFFEEWAKFGYPWNTNTVTIAREFFLSVGGFPSERCISGGDKDLWARIMRGQRCLGYNVETSIYYTDSDNMVTRGPRNAAGGCVTDTLIKYWMESKHSYFLDVWVREWSKYFFEQYVRKNKLPINSFRAQVVSGCVPAIYAYKVCLSGVIKVAHYFLFDWISLFVKLKNDESGARDKGEI